MIDYRWLVGLGVFATFYSVFAYWYGFKDGRADKANEDWEEQQVVYRQLEKERELAASAREKGKA